MNELEKDYTKDYSVYYIAKDGKLTRDFLGDETEVIGIKEEPFGDAFKLTYK